MKDQIPFVVRQGEKILSFGEILLRICPDLQGNWLKENKLPFYIGGAELNVATALALWDLPSAYFSAMPDNAITREIEQDLIEKEIDISSMLFEGDRLGIYYLPKGNDLKHSGVIYDRANSSFAGLCVGQINWQKLFDGVTWFHFSAICPAINQSLADVCLEAVKAAKERNIVVSIDLNFRSKLWKYGKEPVEIMPELVKYCDLIMGNVWAAHNMLGTRLNSQLQKKEAYNTDVLIQQAEETSEEIMDMFKSCKAVANTFRFDQGRGINYHTTLYSGNKLIVSAKYFSDDILDKVGSGDCFMAGLIYGFYNQLSIKEVLGFATAAAFNKLFIASDATTSDVEGVKRTMKRENE
ncbi:2-dehydro-3-deoxygluconokinase [Pedobacter sp. UYEF25]